MAPPDPLLFPVVSQTTLGRAQQRARRLWPTSKGFQYAYLKGWRARRAGLPMDACPYKRLYRVDGTGTWGWKSGSKASWKAPERHAGMRRRATL